MELQTFFNESHTNIHTLNTPGKVGIRTVEGSSASWKLID